MEINIPSQQIYANSKGGLIIEGGVMSSEYGISKHCFMLLKQFKESLNNCPFAEMAKFPSE